jgi:transcriptional regulator with XRE-family HTH domain
MNEVAKQIGQRIQELRKEAGMTQTQLAEKCGMMQPNIARIEAGTYATSIHVLYRIAEALDKRIELA